MARDARSRTNTRVASGAAGVNPGQRGPNNVTNYGSSGLRPIASNTGVVTAPSAFGLRALATIMPQTMSICVGDAGFYEVLGQFLFYDGTGVVNVMPGANGQTSFSWEPLLEGNTEGPRVISEKTLILTGVSISVPQRSMGSTNMFNLKGGVREAATLNLVLREGAEIQLNAPRGGLDISGVRIDRNNRVTIDGDGTGRIVINKAQGDGRGALINYREKTAPVERKLQINIGNVLIEGTIQPIETVFSRSMEDTTPGSGSDMKAAYLFLTAFANVRTVKADKMEQINISGNLGEKQPEVEFIEVQCTGIDYEWEIPPIGSQYKPVVTYPADDACSEINFLDLKFDINVQPGAPVGYELIVNDPVPDANLRAEVQGLAEVNVTGTPGAGQFKIDMSARKVNFKFTQTGDAEFDTTVRASQIDLLDSMLDGPFTVTADEAEMIQVDTAGKITVEATTIETLNITLDPAGPTTEVNEITFAAIDTLRINQITPVPKTNRLFVGSGMTEGQIQLAVLVGTSYVDVPATNLLRMSDVALRDTAELEINASRIMIGMIDRNAGTTLDVVGATAVANVGVDMPEAGALTPGAGTLNPAATAVKL